MTRNVSPLRQAEDAHLVDTSCMSFDESVDMIKKLIKNTEEKK